MTAKSNPVILGVTNTTIYECPATFAAFARLFVANVSGTAATYTLRFFKASTGITTTISPATALAGNAPLASSIAFSMEAGDKLLGQASIASAISATPVVSLGDSSAAFGLTPQGEWSAGATYLINDVVSVASSGNSWISTQSGNINHAPVLSPAYWMLLSDRGTAGLSIGPASGITFTPVGSIAATDVQAAITELDADHGAWSVWTPTVYSGTGTLTAATAAARYKQINKLVHFSVSITITNIGTAGQAIICTLPVTTQNTGFTFAGRENAAIGALLIAWTAATNLIYIQKYDGTFIGANGYVLAVSGSYEAA